MASPPVCDPGCQNVRAFLKLLRWAVNYPNDGDFVYYKLYGGKSFTDTSRHPNRAILTSGRPDPSTAAGAYMLTYPAWKAAQLKGIVADFTPASQDRLAWWRIGQRGAQLAVCGGIRWSRRSNCCSRNGRRCPAGRRGGFRCRRRGTGMRGICCALAGGFRTWGRRGRRCLWCGRVSGCVSRPDRSSQGSR